MVPLMPASIIIWGRTLLCKCILNGGTFFGVFLEVAVCGNRSLQYVYSII
jgi:hypothetical protein